MTDTNYNILFDHLEWAQHRAGLRRGSAKLSACCLLQDHLPYELECPFESSLVSESPADAIEWKSERVVCPVNTSKVGE
jgi:hypothetical protein